ncbi:MAG: AraC family transcriptional regulator [Nevskiaceae bacterium]|nr:MAG: AraC family transcriptional regulator [Nevskiaceae bacterium]
MGNLLRAANLRGYEELVRQLGCDPARLLARFHIPKSFARDGDLFLSYRNVSLLLEASATDFECPDFGLRLSRWQGLDILGPIAVIARNAENVLDAFEAISRYIYVHSPALRVSLEQPSGQRYYRLVFEIVEPNMPQQRQAHELGMANGMQILRMLGGPRAKPLKLFLPTTRIAPEKAYRELFGCPVIFEQSWCGFHLPMTLLRQPIDHANSDTKRLAIMYLQSQYPPGTTSVAVRITELIRRLLPTGHCCIEAVAEQMAMHPRTLQRRLIEEGKRYDDLLDQQRREQAARYLAETDMHLSQITGLLGYTEQSALNRSVRRWFGTTPGAYRTSLRRKNRSQ